MAWPAFPMTHLFCKLQSMRETGICRIKDGRIIACALLMAILVATGCHPKRAVQPSAPATPVHAAVTPAPAPAPAARDAREAVARGLDYLGRAGWDLEWVYLYSHLQPRFGWPQLPAQAQTDAVRDSLQAVGGGAAEDILYAMRLFDRLVHPDGQPQFGPDEAFKDLDAITAPALYCDTPLLDSARFLPLIRRNAGIGGYQSTHALLCYLWVAERGCPAKEWLQPLRQTLLQQNYKVVAANPAWNDVAFEAAAMLRAAGEQTPKAWVEEVVKAQRPDGGWGLRMIDGESHTHATIFALWFLAQAD